MIYDRKYMTFAVKHSHIIAVDLGATHVRTALVSASGSILAKVSEPTVKQGRNGGIVSEQIIRMIRGIRTAHPAKIKGIGIASIGPLDYRRGGPVRSPNVPFVFIPLVSPLRRAFRVPVSLMNDCNAAVLGEQRFGAGKNKQNIVYITISTGIGAGVIANGKLLLGRGGNAAEVGHFIVDTKYNLPCSCGKGSGHWEGYASGANIPRFFHHWLRIRGETKKENGKTAKEIFALARTDGTAREFLRELSRINARAISTIIAAYDPEIIMLGGSVALGNPSVILGGIKKYVDRFLKLPLITITPLGEDVSLLGAAAAAYDDIPERYFSIQIKNGG